MGVTSRTEYRVVPMPRTGMHGDGDPDIQRFEVMLNKLVGEGWSPILLPLDMYQPAFIVSRRHELNLDEQVTEVLKRMSELDMWAPESGLSQDELNVAIQDNRDDAVLLIKATLAVK